MTVDRASLRSWYLGAMGSRIEELRGFRAGIVAGTPGDLDAARKVAQALRGSGGSFGFPELSAVSGLVESAPDAETLRRTEGLIEYLHRLRDVDRPSSSVRAEWLARAAGVAAPPVFVDLSSAWRDLGVKSGLGEAEMAERAAVMLGLRTADLSRPDRPAFRLVPEALMRSATVLPIAEDEETVTVAAADPTSLTTELELTRLTGRRPVFVVAPPDALAHALAALVEVAAAEGGPRRKAAARAPGEKARVLVVDDDIGSRLLARSVLEKQGHDVVEASNGLEALERLRGEQQWSLVVADLNMPELDGLELIWEMREVPDWLHIPVLVLTGETDELLETKLIEEGADDYLSKPLDPRLFLARVGATMRRAEE